MSCLCTSHTDVMNLTAYHNRFSIHHRLVDIQQPPDKTYYIYLIIQLQDSKVIFEYFEYQTGGRKKTQKSGDTFYSIKKYIKIIEKYGKVEICNIIHLQVQVQQACA